MAGSYKEMNMGYKVRLKGVAEKTAGTHGSHQKMRFQRERGRLSGFMLKKKTQPIGR